MTNTQPPQPPRTDGQAADAPIPATVVDPTTLDASQEDGLPSARALRRASSGLDANGRLRSGKLAGLSMTAAIVTLSWPILIESFLNSMVGLTDTFLAAQISEAATDAIGGASYVMWFIGLVAMSVAAGGTALVSRAVGASRLAVANAALAQSLILGLIAAVVVGIFVAITAPLAARILSLHGEAHDAFVSYLRIIATGVPGMAILAVGIACARGAGDSLRPLMSMVIVNVVNMVASFLLSGADLKIAAAGDAPARILLEHPCSFNLGTRGIAIGTVIGDYCGAAFTLFLLFRGTSGITLLRHRLRVHWVTLRRLIRLAVPSFLETFGMWIGNFFIILIVGWIGMERAAHGVAKALAEHGASEQGGAMGAHIIAIRIESFSFLPGFAIGTAAATLVGQYLGANAPHLARRAILICTVITSILMGITGVAFILFPKAIVSLISTQPAHLELAPMLMFITGWVQIPFGIGIVLRSALRGAGDAKAVAYLMWVSTYLIRLPLVYVLSGVDIPLPGGGVIDNPFFSEPSLSRLWIALCAEIVLRAVLYSGRFLQGKWAVARI